MNNNSRKRLFCKHSPNHQEKKKKKLVQDYASSTRNNAVLRMWSLKEVTKVVSEEVKKAACWVPEASEYSTLY